MCEKFLALVVILCAVFGCGRPDPVKYPEKPPVAVVSNVVVSNVLQAKIGDFIYDGEGRKYQKRTDVVKLDGASLADVWERVDPLVTNKWYTPTLGSTIFTNDPPSFNTLFRMEGETEPYFKK